MNTVEILKSAKAVIINPEDWTQDAFSRNKNGERLTNGYDEGGVCFCSLGAVEKVTSKPFWSSEKAVEFLQRAACALFQTVNIPGINDTRTHSEVMAVWDKAIQLAEEKQ